MLEDDRTCKTLSVPTAGRLYYGLGRNASYSAAKRGDIPVIRVGRMLRVPVTLWNGSSRVLRQSLETRW